MSGTCLRHEQRKDQDNGKDIEAGEGRHGRGGGSDCGHGGGNRRRAARIGSRAVAATETGNVPETVASGETAFIPLNKLKKSPRNARKTPHSEADIEAYAASIAAKGILQNLVVEPERDEGGQPTGFYFVTIGEGRRLAQLLRVKRKQIKKTEAIRCVIDTTNDPFEISLDENVTRTAMHPADQFEAFRELAEHRGWGAEEIAARFGVTAHVVKQRLRLGAVSPKLMQVYRDGELILDQLMAFAITEDHARHEQVYDNLSYNRDPSFIRRDIMKTHIPATDRRAIFIGAEVYTEAGGNIVRDLFTEDRGGLYEDAALLDRLVIERLEGIAANIQEAEGWTSVSGSLKPRSSASTPCATLTIPTRSRAAACLSCCPRTAKPASSAVSSAPRTRSPRKPRMAKRSSTACASTMMARSSRMARTATMLPILRRRTRMRRKTASRCRTFSSAT
jgi:ParB-like chromosome segregation protein Spo0J